MDDTILRWAADKAVRYLEAVPTRRVGAWPSVWRPSRAW